LEYFVGDLSTSSFAEGGLLGVLSDFFGDEIAEIRAPFAGVGNFIVATPPVSKGEPVAMVSCVKSGEGGNRR
jgi:hypothetical protein